MIYPHEYMVSIDDVTLFVRGVDSTFYPRLVISSVDGVKRGNGCGVQMSEDEVSNYLMNNRDLVERRVMDVILGETSF